MKLLKYTLYILFFILLFTTNLMALKTARAETKTLKRYPSLVKGSDDYYSSLVGVQNLAKTEQQLVIKLLRYRRRLKETVELINYYLDDYSSSIKPTIKYNPRLKNKIHNKKYPIFKSEEDLQLISEKISANPLTVFKMLRRFVNELADIKTDVENIGHHADFKEFIESLSSNLYLPEITDLSGAADGLLRLQETYQLPTHQMSKGVLIDVRTDAKLLASDMLFIGARAINQERYATGLEWLYEAYKTVLQGDDSMPIDVVRGYLLTARTLHNDELLRFKITPSNLFSNLVNSTYTNIPELFITPPLWEYHLGLTIDTLYDVYNFNALCRGEQLLSPKKTKSLRCWYSKSNSPLNLISPLKVELHHENPPVFQVYDLISDKVIDHIKQKALPYLQRAKVFRGPDPGGVKSDVRTSSVAWLVDRNPNDTLLSRIPRVVKRATGLECDSSQAAEDLQVSCYGSVGGYYIPHLDSLLTPGIKLSPANQKDFIRGDRIATMMFYLTDVELGGGTAFPRLGIASKPIKGSAVIWYNLKKNGNRDLLTLHGGCPVLLGNKWVANKWIRHFEQVHVRKCSRLESE